MPRINKKSNAYEKLADHWKKIGHREWAKALNNEGGIHYQLAREAYAKSDRARHAARFY